MAKFYDNTGALQDVPLTADIYKAAKTANKSVRGYINSTYAADLKVGTAYDQMKASVGLVVPKGREFGLRSPTVAEILDGTFHAATGVQGNSTPFGTESRVLFPTAVVDMIESAMQKDRETEASLLDQAVAVTHTVDGDHYMQPVVNYTPVEAARAQRIAQLAEPAAMVRFTTSDTFKKIPTFGIGAEFSQQALRNTTLDMVGLTLTRYLAVERDASTYEAINSMVSGDSDINIGAVPAVTSNSLDASATGGVLTHKAWVKWLAAARKTRKIDTLIMDINAYLAVEARTGRPGSNNYDPTLSRIDPQAAVVNSTFGGNLRIILVDTAAEGGPLAANTVVGIDSRYAIAKAVNLQAEYMAAEQFALRRSEALRIDYGHIHYRLVNDVWTVLTIS